MLERLWGWPARIRRRLAHKLRRATARHAYMIAGLGRCGTTLLVQALREHGFVYSNILLPRMEQLTEPVPGTIYKTHALPPSTLPAHVKLIYLFGDPLDIVVSTHRQINEWGAGHHRNFGSESFVSNDAVFHEDTLGLTEHFAQWYRPQGFCFLTLRYEKLYTRPVRRALDDYLGFALPLPAFRPRQTIGAAHARKSEILSVYRGLIQATEAADDVRLWIKT